ncbi:helix-turn-helix domain-containing protein [Caulobacter segnis]
MSHATSLWRGVIRVRTVPVCNEARHRQMPPRVRAIVDEVAEKYDLRSDQLIGRGPARVYSHPRFEAIYRVRSEISINGSAPSLPLIGSWFGGRDHTSIMNALRRHEELNGLSQAEAA